MADEQKELDYLPSNIPPGIARGIVLYSALAAASLLVLCSMPLHRISGSVAASLAVTFVVTALAVIAVVREAAGRLSIRVRLLMLSLHLAMLVLVTFIVWLYANLVWRYFVPF